MLYPEIKVGDLVAAIAVVISAVAVLVALAKERALRKKELADRVRQGAALVVAKLDRWKQMALQTFDQLEAETTDACNHLVRHGDAPAARDMFWKRVVKAKASLSKSVLDDEIEIAYSTLFGYDARIHGLFTEVVARLRHIENLIFAQVVNRTQANIFTVQAPGRELSEKLGNKLRQTLRSSRSSLDRHMEEVLTEFRKGMLVIVNASDRDLVNRKIDVPSSKIFQGIAELKNDIYSDPTSAESHDCEAMWDSSKNSQWGTRVLDPWSGSSSWEIPEGLLERINRAAALKRPDEPLD